MKFEAVILCGGKSRRMGRDKAQLPWRGRTFLTHLLEELSEYEELLSSADHTFVSDAVPHCVVADIHPGCGPMGGIHAALCFCQSDALLALSCDLPLFRS